MTPAELTQIEERLRRDRCMDEDVWALAHEVRRLRSILTDCAKDIEDHDCYDSSSTWPHAGDIIDLMEA